MSDVNPVALSDTDLEVLALIEQTNREYEQYVEVMRRQFELWLGGLMPAPAPSTHELPLGLVIRTDDDALVERTTGYFHISTG